MKNYMKDIDNRFTFTNKNVRELRDCGYFYDAICHHLTVRVSRTGSSYYFFSNEFKKLIGNVYEVTVEDARKVAQNVNENFKEVLKTKFPKRINLVRDFAENGYFPRKKIESSPDTGTNKILSAENLALKEKIKELTEENNSLGRQVNLLRDMINKIEDVIMNGSFCEVKDE